MTFHHTALYELMHLVVLFGVLYFIQARARRQADGQADGEAVGVAVETAPPQLGAPLAERREADEHRGDEAAGELDAALPHRDQVDGRVDLVEVRQDPGDA